MMSSYDRWATQEGPAFVPVEVAYEDWVNNKADETYAPFDETHCYGCKELIGSYLQKDGYEPHRDRAVFTLFWIMDEDCQVLLCEDCYLNATEEVE